MRKLRKMTILDS